MYVHIKICGLTNLVDAQAAVQSGADMLGFIFYPKSPRYIAPHQVADLLNTLRIWWNHSNAARHADCDNFDTFPATVGVFVNSPSAYVEETMHLASLDLAQLHGDESEEAVSRFRGSAYKAVRPADRANAIRAAPRFATLGPVAGPQLLLDAYDPHAYGGTGKRANWTTARELARRHSGILLAGGLTPDNVGRAVTIVQPWGVDVSSGVESQPAHKDHDRIRRFVAAVRVAQTSLTCGAQGTDR